MLSSGSGSWKWEHPSWKRPGVDSLGPHHLAMGGGGLQGPPTESGRRGVPTLRSGAGRLAGNKSWAPREPAAGHVRGGAEGEARGS